MRRGYKGHDLLPSLTPLNNIKRADLLYFDGQRIAGRHNSVPTKLPNFLA